MANGIVHIELTVGDLGAAVKFYSDIFGWQTQPLGDNYVVFNTGSEPGGGLMKRDSPEQPSCIIYVHVEDIEATLAKINAAGGTTVVPKTKISDEHGYFAVFVDPQGVAVGLWNKS